MIPSLLAHPSVTQMCVPRFGAPRRWVTRPVTPEALVRVGKKKDTGDPPDFTTHTGTESMPFLEGVGDPKGRCRQRRDEQKELRLKI